MCSAVEAPDVSRSAIVQARKPHYCAGHCGAPIERGERYWRCASLCDGAWASWAMHVECFAFVSHVAIDVCGDAAWSMDEGVAAIWRDVLAEHPADVTPRTHDLWAAVVTRVGRDIT